MENGCWRPAVIRTQQSSPFDIQHSPWKPLARHQCTPARRRKQEIDALLLKTQTTLQRAHKVLNKQDEKPRDLSNESYGRQMAYRRSTYGSTVGVQRRDPIIDIRPPRECFLATQAHTLLNLVTDVVDSHHQRQMAKKVDFRKPRTNKVEKIPPPVLLPPFNLHIKQRPLSKSYYLGGSLRARRETLAMKEKDKAKARKSEGDGLFVAGHGIRFDRRRSTEIPEGLGYQNARKNVEEKLGEYTRNYQARRELSFRATALVKEKRRTRMTLFLEHERHSMEVKAAIAKAKEKH
ncbi:hypothetical protein MPTK2_3g11360 [Marchantia polymorpha subsp. ruderalis]